MRLTHDGHVSTYLSDFEMLIKVRVCVTLIKVLRCYRSFFCVDFEDLLKLEPGNKQAMNELKKLTMVTTILIGTVITI